MTEVCVLSTLRDRLPAPYPPGRGGTRGRRLCLVPRLRTVEPYCLLLGCAPVPGRGLVTKDRDPGKSALHMDVAPVAKPLVWGQEDMAENDQVLQFLPSPAFQFPRKKDFR